MKHRWIQRTIDEPAVVKQLQKELNDLPEALARSLVLRGVMTLEASRRYFRPSLDELNSSFLMQDMPMAAERVAQAIEQGERVLVYGDYDVDGTTATALVTHFLRTAGVDASYFIPDRLEHGYGLCKAGLDYAAEQGASLVVALDCGITAHEEAEYAREQGLDLIICDHHTAQDTLPNALAVLNPKRGDCPYPFKSLCGCGVGFKLIQAVLSRLGRPPEEAHSYLDLLALSTAADIVPMQGENRVLMREGLTALQERPRLGVRMLAKEANLDLSACNTGNLVFSLGPRINAAGRMGDAGRAVDLLLAEDEGQAASLASELETFNEARREADQATRKEATRLAETYLAAKTRHSVVLHQPGWHPGIIGIVASRIVERFYRPTILLTTVNGIVKGSARSISGLNVYDALAACEDLLTQFGGHAQAAGLSLPEENLPAFKERFDEVVKENLSADMLIPAIKVDASLDLNAISERFWAVLKQFAPHGPANSKPVFQGSDLAVVGTPRTVGREGKHLKFNVRQRATSDAKPLGVIGFGMGGKLDILQKSQRSSRPLELLFSVEENSWNGRTSLQLKARDLRLADG